MKVFPDRARARRLAVALSLLAAVLGFYFWRTWWSPELTLETEHYVIRSSSTRERTEEMGRALETLYAAYTTFMADLPGLTETDGKLDVRLYRNRPEFRRCNPRAGWAEAFYRRGRCHAYYGAGEVNRYHWMLHEATHQLNDKAAHLSIPKWVDEGLADYFGSSLYHDGSLSPGRPDPTAYPVWWLDSMRLSGDVDTDIGAGEIIPLRAIITGKGGPSMDEEFNLYYLHWWSLTHFLFQHDAGRYRAGYLKIMTEGGTLDAFERHIGPVDDIQALWYEHLRGLQRGSPPGDAARDAQPPSDTDSPMPTG